MYILGGKFKGKKLANCKSKATRPAMAVVRKSIFDLLKDFVCEINVLDLCAGTGVLGLEALSRGAKSLTLIDSNKDSVKVIKKNLELCNVDAKIICAKLPEILFRFNKDVGVFDLIFLDPPYGSSKFIEEILQIIDKKKLLSKDGLISIEAELKSDFSLPGSLTLLKERKFGNTKIVFLRSKDSEI